MSYVLIALGALVGLGVGVILGLKTGSVLGGRPKTFWAVVGLLFVAVVVAAGMALQSQMVWVAAMSLGVLAGGLTGLKYGRDTVLRSIVTPPGR